MILIRPFFSKLTRPYSSKVCKIFTAWEYVQSTSFASCDPYFARDTFPRAMSIIAGFRLKNRSKFSAMLLFGSICSNVYIRVILAYKFF